MNNSLDPIQLADKYSKVPLFRGLIQLIPFGVGSAIDASLIALIENIRTKKLKTFFDELARGDIILSEELIKSEDFLHCYFATSQAYLNSRRTEKIKLFARLLKSSFEHNKIIDVDEYEELLSILDDLSFREISILFKLDKFEVDYPKKDDENELQRASRFWDKFIDEITSEFQISIGEANSIMTRLNRSGCYETFIGGYFGYTGDKGKLTDIFFKLKNLIKEE